MKEQWARKIPATIYAIKSLWSKQYGISIENYI